MMCRVFSWVGRDSINMTDRLFRANGITVDALNVRHLKKHLPNGDRAILGGRGRILRVFGTWD